MEFQGVPAITKAQTSLINRILKGIICTEPGTLKLTQLDKPVLKPGHSIIKIRRIGICGTDLHAFEGTQPYFKYPRILGHELAAEYAQGGADFAVGEALTIIPYFNCGHCIACKMGKPNCCSSIEVCGVHVDGGMVEYLMVPDAALIHGNGLSLDELALVEPLAIGAHGVSRAGVTPQEFVLVIGAGPIGLGVMEFARRSNAQVIALDIHEGRLRFCKEKLGIEFVINGRTEPVIERLRAITSSDMPSVVIDATGNQRAINEAFYYLSHGGRYVLVGLQKGDLIVSHPEFHKRESTLMSSRNATVKDFQEVMASLKSGAIQPANYITHKIQFEELPQKFPGLLDPSSGVIKAVVELS